MNSRKPLYQNLAYLPHAITSSPIHIGLNNYEKSYLFNEVNNIINMLSVSIDELFFLFENQFYQFLMICTNFLNIVTVLILQLTICYHWQLCQFRLLADTRNWGRWLLRWKLSITHLLRECMRLLRIRLGVLPLHWLMLGTRCLGSHWSLEEIIALTLIEIKSLLFLVGKFFGRAVLSDVSKGSLRWWEITVSLWLLLLCLIKLPKVNT